MEEYKKKKKAKNRNKKGKVSKVIYFYSDRMESKLVTTCVFSMFLRVCVHMSECLYGIMQLVLFLFFSFWFFQDKVSLCSLADLEHTL